MLAVLFAHGSGIDDVLWFLIPVVIALFVLRRAERRASRREPDPDPVDSTTSETPER